MVVVVDVAAVDTCSLAGIISVRRVFAGDTCTRRGWKPDAGVASAAVMVRVPMTTAAAVHVRVRVVAGDVPMIDVLVHAHVYAWRRREVAIVDACGSLSS